MICPYISSLAAGRGDATMALRRAYSRVSTQVGARLQYRNAINLTKLHADTFRIGPTVAKQLGISQEVNVADFDLISRRLLTEMRRTLVIAEENKPIRVMSPASVRPAISDLSQHIYIAAVCVSAAKRVGLAWTDPNDGSIWFQESSQENLADDLARINPNEIVVESPAATALEALDLYPVVYAKFPRELAGFAGGFDYWQSVKHSVEKIPPSCLAAIAGLLGYLIDSGKTALKLDVPREYLMQNTLDMDKRTRITLELFSSASGSTRGSLYSAIKRTKTQSGARLLHQLLSSPSRNMTEINSRLDIVDKLVSTPGAVIKIREALTQCPDGRLCIQRLSVQPSARHLFTWSQSMESIKYMKWVLEAYPQFSDWSEALDACIQKTGKLSSKIYNNLDRDGGIDTFTTGYQPLFKPAISKPIADLHKTNQEFETICKEVIQEYSTRYDRPEVQWNSTFGYHIRVKSQPHPSDLVLRAGKKTSRLQDPRLSQAGKVREQFDHRLEQLEKKLLLKLHKQTMDLNTVARAGLDVMDEIDVDQSFARLAKENNLVRPTIVAEPILDIVGGRHIAVEEFLMLEEGTNFIPNDCQLTDTTACMITGPNMGGKSTYMRQMATISILAHMGCYVPAESARIGLIDKIFCRIGSGDDGYRGQSTFMIEMLETSHIISNATPQSLAMLDEVGRGTSKQDGVALAYASIHHIVTENKCRALFSTHFGLGIQSLLSQDNLNVKMQQSINYKMVSGVCTDSRGLEMASMANFPKKVINDAMLYIQSKN